MKKRRGGFLQRSIAPWSLLGTCAAVLTLSSYVFAQKVPVAPQNPPPPALLTMFPPGILPPGLTPPSIPMPTGIPRWIPMTPPIATPVPSVQGPPPHRTVQAHLLRPESALLESPLRSDQLRGVVRAAASNSSESTALLLELWTGRSRVLKDAEIMHAFTRGLARRRPEPRVRETLASILGTWGTTDATQATHARLVRYTAAFALAEDGSEESVRALFIALDRDGTHDAAAAALLRFPPRKRPSSGALQLSPRVLAFLEELGDLRFADDILRATASPKPEVRAAALHAAAVLPDTRAAEVARRALAETATTVRAEATFALTKLHAKDADVLVANLLSDEATAERGAQIASLVETDKVVRALSDALAKHKDPAVQSAVLHSLARFRNDSALDVLVSAVANPTLKAEATRALAFSDAPSVAARIERLARRGGPSDLAAAIQAYALRRLIRGTSVESGAMNDLVRTAATTAPRSAPEARAEREELAPAWFALGILGKGPQTETELRSFLGSATPTARRAFASALALTPPRSQDFVRLWLGQEHDDKTLRVLVAAVLSHPETAGILSRRDAFVRATSMGVEAPLAAQVWVSDATQENGEEGQVTEWLHAVSANLRAATARGLRSGKLRTAVGILTSSYDAEPDADVRVAILSSLATLLESRPRAATGSALHTLLSETVAYDPDPLARYHASRALGTVTGPAASAVPATPATFATLVSVSESTITPVGLYVAPGPVFRVVPFAFGQAIIGGIPERTGKLNLAVELP